MSICAFSAHGEERLSLAKARLEQSAVLRDAPSPFDKLRASTAPQDERSGVGELNAKQVIKC